MIRDRRIILKCHTGSRLYGTSTPSSDTDYSGIFLPSTEDMMGTENCPMEWTHSRPKGDGERNGPDDVDCKFYSLRRWMNLAAQGQPGQLEMLFLPSANIQVSTPVYCDLLMHTDIFLSKQSIRPFIGFALSQAHKAEIKGENLNLLREILRVGQLTDRQARLDDLRSGDQIAFYEKLSVPITRNDHDYEIVEIAGRKYDLGIRLGVFLDSLRGLEARYGSRSEAAAASGQDFKSLMHCYRLLSQAEELLILGKITFPRPDAQFLLQVRRGEYVTDWHQDVMDRIKRIEDVIVPESPLRDRPDHARINELCIEIHSEHFGTNA